MHPPLKQFERRRALSRASSTRDKFKEARPAGRGRLPRSCKKTRDARGPDKNERGKRVKESAREGRCLLEMVIIKSRRVGAHRRGVAGAIGAAPWRRRAVGRPGVGRRRREDRVF